MEPNAMRSLLIEELGRSYRLFADQRGAGRIHACIDFFEHLPNSDAELVELAAAVDTLEELEKFAQWIRHTAGIRPIIGGCRAFLSDAVRFAQAHPQANS